MSHALSGCFVDKPVDFSFRLSRKAIPVNSQQFISVTGLAAQSFQKTAGCEQGSRYCQLSMHFGFGLGWVIGI